MSDTAEAFSWHGASLACVTDAVERLARAHVPSATRAANIEAMLRLARSSKDWFAAREACVGIAGEVVRRASALPRTGSVGERAGAVILRELKRWRP